MSPAGGKELLYSTREEQVNLLAQVRVSQHNRLSPIWILISILAIAMPATVAALMPWQIRRRFWWRGRWRGRTMPQRILESLWIQHALRIH